MISIKIKRPEKIYMTCFGLAKLRQVFICALMVKMFSLTLFIASTGSLAFAESGDQSIYDESYKYEKAKEYKNAIKTVMPIYSRYPRGYAVNLTLGWLYYLDGSYVKSRLHYKKAMIAKPSSLEAKLAYALPLLKQKKWDKAEEILNNVLAVDNYNYQGNLKLVYALRKQGNYELAERVSRKMLAIYPADASLLKELALVEKEGASPLALHRQRAPEVGHITVNAKHTSYRSSEERQSSDNLGVYAKHLIKNESFNGSLDFGGDVLIVRNISGDKYRQEEFTGVVNIKSISLPYLAVRFGLHTISSRSKLADTGATLISGISYAKPFRWNVGIDLFKTRYLYYDSADKGADVDLLQASPYFGFRFGGGKFYSATRADYIRPSGREGIKEKTYSSFEEEIAFFLKPLRFSVKGWSGERVYPVLKGGLIAVNSAYKYRSGYGASIKYNTFKRFSAEVGMEGNRFKSIGASKITTATTYFALIKFTL